MKVGWETKRLGNVSTVINGGTPKSNVADYWGGPVQWLTPKDMGRMTGRTIGQTPRTITELGLSKSSARKAPAGSVILSTRAPIGHLALNDVPMAFNQGCRGLIPSDELDPLFLYYFLLAERDQLNELGTGTTFKELSATNLKSVEIPLPPLEEQQRIIAILDEAFEGLDRAKANAEANLASAKELFQAALDGLFQEKAGRTEPLNALCTGRGITYGVIKLGEHQDDGVPCLRTSNVRHLEIDTGGMKRITAALAAEYGRTILQGGEVLVNVRGTLGGVATVPEKMAGWNISREVAMVAIDHERMAPSFVASFIGTRTAQRWLTGVVKGAAYKGINLTDLRNLPVPMVSRSQQELIANEAETLRSRSKSSSAACARKLGAINQLRQSLLAKAFAGELT